MVETEHQYIPSSSNVAYTSAGATSTSRSERSVSSTASLSADDSARGDVRTGSSKAEAGAEVTSLPQATSVMLTEAACASRAASVR